MSPSSRRTRKQLTLLGVVILQGCADPMQPTAAADVDPQFSSAATVIGPASPLWQDLARTLVGSAGLSPLAGGRRMRC